MSRLRSSEVTLWSALGMALLGVITAPDLHGQESLGARAGLTLATIHGSHGSDEYTRTAGLTAGLYTVLWASHRLSLQPEVFYVQRGAQIVDLRTFDGIPQYFDAKARYHYVDFSILLRGQFGGSSRTGWIVGPVVSRLIAARRSGEFASYDLEPGSRRYLAGVAGGLSFRRPSWSAEVRYSYSGPSPNHGVISIMLGVPLV